MPGIALALPLDLEDRVSIDLARHGFTVTARCSSADELAAALAAPTSASEFAVVAASPRYLTDRLMVEADAAGVRIVALVASDSERRHAASLGLREVADVDSDWATIEVVLFGEPSGAEPVADHRHGTVLAVWGPAGAPGRTTMAIGLAAELAASGATVALADVDTHSGSIAPVLGLLDEAPGFAAACRLAGADALTQPELSGERVAATISACRDWVDYTVLDTGASLENDEEISSDLFAPRRNAATLSALRQADEVIAVGSADPVGLSRFLRAHVDLLETIDTDRITVVMNKIRTSAIGSGASGQVRQTLQRFGGIDSPVLVPHDLTGFDAAVLSGKTLCDVAPKSPARLAIARLVSERFLPAAEQPVRRSWLRRPVMPRTG
jgi:MinD-like ATPase involved in chromosome partitioning or flagellar assembly